MKKRKLNTFKIIIAYILTFIFTFLIFKYVNFNNLILTLFIKLPLNLIPIILLYRLENKGNQFDMYFGVPGSGKTTFATYLYKKELKKNKNKKVFTNIPIIDTYILDKNDIGKYQIDNSLILWDEISGDFDNRDFKTNFKDNQLMWFKKHRHYKVDICMFSQSYNDADKKLRDLTTRLFIIKKSFLPFFVSRREMKKKIDIDEITKQPSDQYYWVFFLFGYKLIFTPPLWKHFNSWDAPKLEYKEFKKWANTPNVNSQDIVK